MNKVWMAGLVLALNAAFGNAALASSYETDHARAQRPAEAPVKKAEPKKQAAASRTQPAQKNGKSKTSKSTKKRCQHSTFCWR
ncbi:Tfp pilus assembly protein PilX [Silvimonas terrae]|uniref:Tfp pilus assembly protein PilX n=1 Tax=Silvimonas terrae TaxID=300266 RepID=A0A840RC15_9NEIS|nr:hypothetical protein [Silvimonas terrae]MBB5190999.1 Tfp pilus assembly protein PilX [Silvimonas terrae]